MPNVSSHICFNFNLTLRRIFRAPQDRLAVQLPNQINIYSLVENASGPPKFQLTERLRRKFECNLLVVCSKHVILCQERRLQSFTFDGEKER
jgi:intraflagellar transport protein 122